ncbi:MAG: amidohydrolase family protein [Ignavibacteriales bacterium]
MVIDAHTHIFNQDSLNEYLGKYPSDVFVCIRFIKDFCGGAFEGRDEELDHFVESNPNAFLVESIDFEVNILSQIEELTAKMESSNNIKGIKLYPGYQHFFPYNERLLPAYVFAHEQNIPVILHSGAVYQYENSQAQLQYVNPIYVDEAATRYPDTKFIITHFGFPYIMETAMVLNKNNNVYADISGMLDEDTYEIFKQDIKRALKYYPGITNQILFGTDFIGNDTYLNEVELYVKLVEELFENVEEREAVFFKNAQKVFNLADNSQEG